MFPNSTFFTNVLDAKDDVKKLADIEQQQLQKCKLAADALAQAQAEGPSNNITREQIDLLEKEVDNEKLKFTIIGYRAEAADKKRTKRQMEEKNKQAKRRCTEPTEHDELEKTRDDANGGPSVVLPDTGAELSSHHTKHDPNKSGSMDGSSSTMMKSMATDDIDKIHTAPVEPAVEESTASKTSPHDDDDKDGKHKLQ